MQNQVSLTRDLVLIGGGHTHALVLRKWAMTPLPGARLTVINPGATAPYSGMLPGYVAGHYARADLDIDLVRLARCAGARLIVGAAEGIDLHNRLIHVPDRPAIGFDVASVDIGITSVMPDLAGFAAHAVPAKPLGPFASRWQAYLKGQGPARVAVIGGGVAGAELAMAMAHALAQQGRAAQVTLIDRGHILSALPKRPQARLRRALQALGVTCMENAQITHLDAQGVHLAAGSSIPADFITGAAGAKPYDWIGQTGLALHDGFIVVDDKLRSSDRDVFAVGDCAHMAFAPRPKAGVFAVRQAPVLFDNLRAALAGEPWRRYRPQRDYLKLISLGGKSALAEKAGFPVAGSLMWQWKDHIDQTFMNQFRHLTPMALPAPPRIRARGDHAAQPLCGGCGAKVGRTALQRATAALPRLHDSVMRLPGDDAAVLRIGGLYQVHTTDHLSAVTEDPVLMARFAAIHALGDIWAMGAAPQTALAQIVLPRMSETLQTRTLNDIMGAAGTVLADAGAEVIGGHTTLGTSLSIGFSLTGLCPDAPITLAGARPGDQILLTKAIGTGVVLAAEMAALAGGEDVLSTYASMAQPQAQAARILAGAHAMTDVTGFGLGGHLMGLCQASGVGAVLNLDDIPLLPGALALSDKGVRSSLYADNRALLPDVADQGAAALLFDPQTCGGLLACVDAAAATKLMQALKNAGYTVGNIGYITDQTGIVSVAS